jgi:hypothetical protein
LAVAFSRDERWRLIAGSAVATALLGALLALSTMKSQDMLFSDFTVFWASAQLPPARVYDAGFLTAFQSPWLPDDAGLRPFPYPPTLLLFTRFMAGMPHATALIAWTALGLAAYVAAARAAWNGRIALLSLLSFPVIVTLAAGQVALFASASIVAGVATLDARPRLAGIAFALAAAVKPQLVTLVPIALLAGGCWRALVAAAATGAGLLCLATLAFGMAIWREWLGALPQFLSIVADPRFWPMSVSPYVLGLRLGVPGGISTLIPIVLGTCGAIGVALVFRHRGPIEHRVLVLVAGSMLCAPYGMNYDLAAAAPAAVALLFSRDAKWLDWLAGWLGVTSLGGGLVPIGLVAAAVRARLAGIAPSTQRRAEASRSAARSGGAGLSP